MIRHGVIFKDCPVKWNEALPMGNGCFGAMAYLQKNNLKFAFNHYDLYYSKLPGTDFLNMDPNAFCDALTGGISYEAYLEKIHASLQNGGNSPYQTTLGWTGEKKRDSSLPGVSFPSAGELTFLLDDSFKIQQKTLSLDTETAQVNYQLCGGQAQQFQLTANILKRTSCAYFHISQSNGLIKSIVLAYPQTRNQETFHISFHQESHQLFSYTVTFPDRQIPVSFSFFVSLTGAEAKGMQRDEGYHICLSHQEKEFDVLAAVYVHSGPTSSRLKGLEQLKNTIHDLPNAIAHHKHWWNIFSSKSTITLPDKFLENLWHLHLYVLACCSGEGSRFSEQACGLNGLWDIKKPTLWGSMWYWDINIQAAFWGVYGANHTELSKTFCDGYLKHLNGSEIMARYFYHSPGAAIDYPHTFYNCIGPWCAQFLWWQYEYTKDKEFLRMQAYPAFVKLFQFIREILQWNPQTKTYDIFPDISPEQGPITKNSTITIASIRYLLSFTVRAYDILEESDTVKDTCLEILRHLPDYQTADYQNYGKILKDSDYSPAGIRLRHPSLLMPIFPIGELNPNNRASLAENTVRYALDHTELGVFGFGWLACAAARMRLGDMAYQTLYEKGIDLHLRSNGMGAEETSRWLNLCLITKPPLYHPFMMESNGETIAVVNEMLLQSYDGIIHIFPAIPHHWDNCAFDGLLAKGGFEVCAQREHKKTKGIRIKSVYGGTVSLYISPNELSLLRGCPWGTFQNHILSWKTHKGAEYVLGQITPLPSAPPPAPLSHISHTGETIWLGKNRASAYVQSLDRFLCDRYLADTRIQRLIPYFFSFGWESSPLTEEEQRYDIASCPVLHEPFSPRLGFGFQHTHALQWLKKGEGTHIFHRFVQSASANTFLMDLPAGRYDILICCGDDSAVTVQTDTILPQTVLTAQNEFQTLLLPIVQEDDGFFAIHFDTLPSRLWKLHAVIVRKHYSF